MLAGAATFLTDFGGYFTSDRRRCELSRHVLTVLLVPLAYTIVSLYADRPILTDTHP